MNPNQLFLHRSAASILILAVLIHPTLALASDEGPKTGRLEAPRRLTTAELARQASTRQGRNWNAASAPRMKVSMPKIVIGLAMMGAGAALMATNSQKYGYEDLREGGNLPCRVTNYVNGVPQDSRSTYCSKVMVYERTPAFKGGAGLVSLGGIMTIWGLMKHPRR